MERMHVAALIVPTQYVPEAKETHGVSDPLSPIAGKSVCSWIVDAALSASVRRIGIVAENPLPATRSELVSRSDDALIEFVTPTSDICETLTFAIERLGSELTLSDNTQILLLPAEAPQIDPSQLRALVDTHLASGAAATIVRSADEDLVRAGPVITRDDEGRVASISELPNDSAGIMCIRAALLIPALRRVAVPSWHVGAPLVEIAGVLDELGHQVGVIETERPLRTIHSAASRTPIEMELRDRVITGWIDRGAVMPDPRQVSIDSTVTLGKGVRVLPGSVLEGSTVVGDGAVVGPNTHLVDAIVGTQAVVPHSVVTSSEVAAREQVLPFSVLGDTSR